MWQHLTFVEVYEPVIQASRDVLRDVARSVTREVIDRCDTLPPRCQGEPLPRPQEKHRKQTAARSREEPNLRPQPVVIVRGACAESGRSPASQGLDPTNQGGRGCRARAKQR